MPIDFESAFETLKPRPHWRLVANVDKA